MIWLSQEISKNRPKSYKYKNELFIKLLRNNGQYIISISTSSMCYDLFVKTSMHIGMILYHLIMKYGQNTKVKTEYMYYVGIQNI